MSNKLPKHINHRFVLSNGYLELIHFIASNKIEVCILEEVDKKSTTVSVTRDDLRKIRDRINSILGD